MPKPGHSKTRFGFDRGASLRRPLLRRWLSICARVLVVGALTLSCAAGVLAFAEPGLLALVLPNALTGNIEPGRRAQTQPISNTIQTSVNLTTSPQLSPQDSTPDHTKPTWATLHSLAGFPKDGISLAAINADGTAVAIVWNDGHGGQVIRVWGVIETSPTDVSTDNYGDANIEGGLADQNSPNFEANDFVSPANTATQRTPRATERKVSPSRGFGEITALALSNDGNLVAIGRANGQVELAAFASDRAPSSVAAHTNRVLALAFSADGRRLLSGGADGFARSFATPTLTDPRSVGTGEPVRALSVADGSSLVYALGEDGRVTPIEVASFRATGTAWKHGRCRALAISGDGLRIGAALHDGRVIVATFGTDSIELDLSVDSEPHMIRVSPNGRSVMFEAPSGVFKINNGPVYGRGLSATTARQGPVVEALGQPEGVLHAMRFSRSGRPLAMIDGVVWVLE